MATVPVKVNLLFSSHNQNSGPFSVYFSSRITCSHLSTARVPVKMDPLFQPNGQEVSPYWVLHFCRIAQLTQSTSYWWTHHCIVKSHSTNFSLFLKGGDCQQCFGTIKSDPAEPLMKNHPSFKIFVPEIFPFIFYCWRTNLQRLPLFSDHFFLTFRVVLKEGFHCSSVDSLCFGRTAWSLQTLGRHFTLIFCWLVLNQFSSLTKWVVW